MTKRILLLGLVGGIGVSILGVGHLQSQTLEPQVFINTREIAQETHKEQIAMGTLHITKERELVLEQQELQRLQNLENARIEQELTSQREEEARKQAKQVTTQEVLGRQLIGEFELSFYCHGSCCNGSWVGQPTASGAKMTTGTTIAVDPKVIPLGTKVYIEGIGERVAQDTGSAIKGNKVDVLMDTHSECLELGRQYDKKIWIIE